MREITHIVLHTAASAVRENGQVRVVHQLYNTVREYHVNHNGWNDIGYHQYIRKYDGPMGGRDPELPGAHVGKFNRNTLGLCVSGHGDYERWNDGQVKSVVDICVSWCNKYNIKPENILGHRECSELAGYKITKTCPGKLVDMDYIRNLVKIELEPKVNPTVEMKAVAQTNLEKRVSELESFVEQLKEKTTRCEPYIRCEPYKGTTLFGLTEKWDRNR